VGGEPILRKGLHFSYRPCFSKTFAYWPKPRGERSFMRRLLLVSRPISSFSFSIWKAISDSRGLKLMLQRLQWNQDISRKTEESEKQEAHIARASLLKHGGFAIIHSRNGRKGRMKIRDVPLVYRFLCNSYNTSLCLKTGNRVGRPRFPKASLAQRRDARSVRAAGVCCKACGLGSTPHV
jgi:hypothetical protein